MMGPEMQSPAAVRAPRLARAVEYGLQPALLAGALLVWLPYRDRLELALIVMVVVQIALGVLEHFFPARPDWIQAPREKLANLALVAAFTGFAVAVSALYRAALSEPFAQLRAQLGLELWPSGWPLAARVLLAFLASELVVNASVVHSNLRLSSRGIGWLFTTNAYHLRHHSAVFEESNTNCGCAAIVWDRLFGTLAHGVTREAGIGPREPRLWEKLWLPLRQPGDVTVAPR
jgi:sterol desaturase/sphingolipid hydroxylase (fatty acid hydroxylase superfamily)